MLETNGTLVPPLRRVLPWITYVSMDLKLPSVDGERVAPDVQRRFLAAAVDAGVTTWVKIVVGASTPTRTSSTPAIAMVAGLPLTSAPDTAGRPTTGATAGPRCSCSRSPRSGRSGKPRRPDQVLELQERALRSHPRVRVVPQTHKAIGQL